MGDSAQDHDRISALEAHIEEMRGVIEDQQRQIQELRGETDSHEEGDQVAPRMTSRRGLIKWAGAAAAATAATAAVSVATQQPAHAADGSTFILGSTTNTASSDTAFSVVTGAAPATLLTVDASGSTNNTTAVTGLYAVGALDGTGTEGFASGGGGWGVYGVSDTGLGVVGMGGIDIAAGGSGHMWYLPQSSAGAPTTGTYNQGEVMVDLNGHMWICVASGAPGTWYPLSSQVFLHTPYRIFDTRPAYIGIAPIDPGAPMANNQIITLQITGTVSPKDSTLVVPTGASAIIGNVIAIAPTAAGFLTLQPHSNTPTNSSYLHYYAGQTIHNAVVMGLDSTGKLDIGNYGPATDVALDIAGFVY